MLKFIDSNCMIGRRNVCREGSPETASDFLEVMDRCGIEKAVAFHASAKESDAVIGNLLIEEENASGRLIPQWVVMPNICNRFYAPAELIYKMKENSVTSVRFFQGIYGHSLKRYVSGELIDALTECRVPIFLDKSQISWDELYELLNEYPDTKFVICNTSYGCVMSLWPILGACPNLYVETSTFLMHNGISVFCHDFGAQRLLFGTGMPNVSATASASLIIYSDISDEEKQLVARGNILRLLEEVSL